MNHNSSPRLSASNPYDYRYEDWIDTAAIPNGPFGADPSAGYNMNADFGSDLNAPLSATHSFTRPPLLSRLSAENSLRQALDDTSIYPNSPESRATESSIAESEEMPGILDIESLTVSTAFQESSDDPDRPIPDIILISSDSVVFYVAQAALLNASENSFGDLFPVTSEDKLERVRYLPKVQSSELNVMMHIIYAANCARFCPSLQVVIRAIDHLPKYGIAPNMWVTKTNPIYDFLLLQASMHPLDLYCLCGRHDIYDLGTAVSAHLLSFNLGSLTDEDAESMGSLYLARLFRLHRSRVKTLMGLLMPAPDLHDPTRDCSFESQKALLSAWTMAVVYISQCARPDMLTSTIRSIFASMTGLITCRECLRGRDDRVNKIVVNWTLTKNTI
ncbi:hypothetical protein D9758_006143 [Tetrapyrgos nigripes]|uniref:BTB domain-containing protein n=1 Tax=Tetrapyrgos nigripes TaxID=182062 RepID=A0A8H5GAQ2_9AGAR|nr:hypothetical protein D9758_006143 [Tetrapyrgos nigripes]